MSFRTRLIATTIASGLVAVLAAGEARASLISAFSGDADIKFTGVTAEDPGVPTGNSGGKETTFGAGYMTQIVDHSNPGNVLWSAGQAHQTMSFFLYGIADTGFSGTGPFKLNNNGCTVGAGCDGKIHVDFYLDNTNAFGGTNPGFAGTTNVVKASQRVGNTLPGITDGSLFMKWELVPGVDKTSPTTTLQQTVDALTLPTTGKGTFLADCVSGPGCSLFNSHAITDPSQTADPTAFADFFAQFTLSTPGSSFTDNGWEGFISDPVLTDVVGVPEPGTLATFGFALFCLAGLGRTIGRRTT